MNEVKSRVVVMYGCRNRRAIEPRTRVSARLALPNAGLWRTARQSASYRVAVIVPKECH
jgi:hypothetical protein